MPELRFVLRAGRSFFEGIQMGNARPFPLCIPLVPEPAVHKGLSLLIATCSLP